MVKIKKITEEARAVAKRRGSGKNPVIPDEIIERKIYLIRGKKVMLDKDLAQLYGVTTGRLNEQVKRNRKRFPQDFMYQLTWKEVISSRSQFAILKTRHGKNIKYLPYVFTEQGVAMLSSVLNSNRAIEVNIQIMRAFVRIRELIANHKDLRKKIEELEEKFTKKIEEKFAIHEDQFELVFKAFEKLKKVLQPPKSPKRRIGFK
ncbi:MAG: ORF6N domain-containing protein [Candidatus Omnitrophica bacterium]|nr:ORF6N domain-containing protein [Candidatus Omnitrophota bacterium]